MSKAINYKFILIGNTGVGKTSIFRYLSTGEFVENNISSIEIDKKTLDFSIEVLENKKKVKKSFSISLFDTAGQEQFKSVTFSYFKGSDGILLLYDITNRLSFDNIEMWVNDIRDAIDSKAQSRYAIILIGNKFDLVKENESNRKITEQEAKNACEKYKMVWGGERSIKDINYEELNELFKTYVGYIYDEIGEKKVGKQKVRNIKKYKKKPTFC